MAWVAAYCLGPFGGNERTWKPFNPILGETFELDKEGGVRFLAEQVWTKFASVQTFIGRYSQYSEIIRQPV